jgi:hypothetical protein
MHEEALATELLPAQRSLLAGSSVVLIKPASGAKPFPSVELVETP